MLVGDSTAIDFLLFGHGELAGHSRMISAVEFYRSCAPENDPTTFRGREINIKTSVPAGGGMLKDVAVFPQNHIADTRMARHKAKFQTIDHNPMHGWSRARKGWRSRRQQERQTQACAKTPQRHSSPISVQLLHKMLRMGLMLFE
jgi:hypothetical protein